MSVTISIKAIKWKKIQFLFYHFSICISINSEWSKTYDFEGKIQNNLKSFQIHIFTLQNFLIFFSIKKKKTYLVVDRGFTPPPVYGHVRNY